MSLQKYQAKRRFDQTPEPKGAIQRSPGPLRFVVQKHHATRLHFDLRLEVDGTLRSWAVPKGPPFTSKDRRLAVLVEDHPLDYLQFEGVIPKGGYGAGPVMVWDLGSYHLPETTNRQRSEELAQAGLENGKLHFILHGKKLQGEFILIQTKEQEPNSWLWFRKGEGVLQEVGGEDRSVLTGRTMDEISRGEPPRETESIDWTGAPKAPMPHNIKPMLAAPADQPFDHPDWLFEIKWDGYRAIAEVDQGRVRLYSRNLLSFETRYGAIVDSLEHLGHQAVLDGEVVVLNEKSRPTFQLLQEYQKFGKGTLVYEVFDLLYLDGHDLRKLPLVRRKEFLASVVGNLPNVKLSEHIEGRGVAFFEAVSQKGLEGIVGKEKESRYREGVRSPSWRKIKARMQRQAVIGGFTEPKGGRAGLGSLVLGLFEGSDLVYVGHAGTGFTDQTLADLRARLDPLIQKECPFKKRPQTNAPAHWVEPRLVCEVSFGEWTRDGQMRFPVYHRLCEGKDPTLVRKDGPSPAEEPSLPKPAPAENTVPAKKPEELVAGREVRTTNLNKIYWPEDGYTKGDLIQYYREVSAVILPYLKDRPESLHRHPGGIHGSSFFQKDMSQQPPPAWVQTVDIESDDKIAQTVLCQDEATLIYLANLGCIELNPWNSRVGSLDRADYVLLDLDPENIAFDRVVEAAQMIRKVLDQAGIEACCKTSGKRGLHVYIPFGARHGHDEAKHFAELIARIVNARLPSFTSLVRLPSKRQERVYLDYLQNGKGKTLAAPYSVRPYPGATVSTPLKWSEVRKGLDPGKFTIRTVPKRLEKVGDLWQPVLGPGMDLESSLEKLASSLRKG